MSVFKNSPPIITNGLVVNFDAGNTRSYGDRTGTVWNDMSGNGYSASLVNGPTFSMEGGGSLTLDGTNDYIFTNYSQPIYSATSSFTWNVWTNPRSTAAAPAIAILGSRGADLDFVKLTKSNFQYYPDTIAYTLSSNIWQNICVIKNQNAFTCYVNGVLVGSMNSYVVKPSVKAFYIGGDPVEALGACSVSMAQVYNRALTYEEMLKNFNSQKLRYNIR